MAIIIKAQYNFMEKNHAIVDFQSFNEQNTQAQKKYVYIFVRQELFLSLNNSCKLLIRFTSAVQHIPDTGISNSVIIFGIEDKSQLEDLFEKYHNILDCYPFYEPYKNTGLTAFTAAPYQKDISLGLSSLWKPKHIPNILATETGDTK